MQAVRLFQGYLWHPQGMAFDPGRLPREVEGAYLLLDEVPPPTAFFEDGTPTATQRFYQMTILVKTDTPPEALHPWAERVEKALKPILEGLPLEVGWLLLEDLRPL